MKIPETKLARHETIRKIVKNQRIYSQAELLNHLAKFNLIVTQATLSRDLDELKITKVKDEEPSYYALNQGYPDVNSINTELIVAIDFSANIVVLKTPPGGAQLFASSVDNSSFSEVIGTIAGDDTVLLVTKEPNGAQQVAEQLWEMSRSNR